ncbi:hypothetical protein IG631_20767 [Alternaria alternata]|nr:hypothetical protein IG631_20767 [Alternaria alternata]
MALSMSKGGARGIQVFTLGSAVVCSELGARYSRCLFTAALGKSNVPNTLHGSWVVLSIPDLGHKVFNGVCKIFFRKMIALLKAIDAVINRKASVLDQVTHTLSKKTIGLIVWYFFIGGDLVAGALTTAMTLSLGHTHGNYSFRQYVDGQADVRHLPLTPALLLTAELCGVPSTPGSPVILITPAFSRARKTSFTRPGRNRIA